VWKHSYARFNGFLPLLCEKCGLAVFSAVRTWNVQFIAAQPEGLFAKELNHPERGTMTFRTLVETMAGHDRNHLSQLAT
jgi:hypothetical protein